MERLNGLRTAEEIRKMDGAVGIVFLTSLKQYMRKGYEFHAVNYLLKPVKYKNMKEISALLCTQPQFARCHQSFAVNLSFVRGAEGVEAVLTTGERLPISQPKRNGFMQRMAEYWGELL